MATYWGRCGFTASPMVSKVETEGDLLRQRTVVGIIDVASIQEQRFIPFPVAASLEFCKDAYSL